MSDTESESGLFPHPKVGDIPEWPDEDNRDDSSYRYYRERDLLVSSSGEEDEGPGELQSDADIEELRNQLDAFEPPYPEDENDDSEVGQAAQSGKPAAQSNDESNDDAARSGDPAARSDKSSSDDDFNPSEDESKDSSKSSSKDESAESSDASDSDERPKPKSRSKITLTEHQLSIAQDRLPEFRNLNVEERAKMIQQVTNKVKCSWSESQPKFDRKQVENIVRQCLYNAARRPQKITPFNVRKTQTVKSVIEDLHRTEINDLAIEMSGGAAAGSRQYLGSYKAALRTIKQGLSEETLVRYLAEAKSRNEGKLGESHQCRMFAKKGVPALRSFAKTAYEEFGVRMVILAGYQLEPGEPIISFFDFNKELGGASFKARHKDWQGNAMIEDFSKWTLESFGLDGSPPALPVKATPQITLKRDQNGYLLLPKWKVLEKESLSYRKTLVGTFMKDMYEIATGKEKARVPWKKLQYDASQLIESKFLPKKKVIFSQFHKLTDKDVERLLRHWRKRQVAGKESFRFKKLKKRAKSNKRTAGHLSEEEKDEDEDEDDEDGEKDEQEQDEQDEEEQGASVGNKNDADPRRSQRLGGADGERENLQDKGVGASHSRKDVPGGPRSGGRSQDEPQQSRPRPRRVQPNQTLGDRQSATVSAAEDGDPSQPNVFPNHGSAGEHQTSSTALPQSNGDETQRNQRGKAGGRRRDATDTGKAPTPKRQRVDRRAASQPESRRSERVPKPTERAKGGR